MAYAHGLTRSKARC
uniref:Uncharacterized protein n=1 Tax=Arundo donax TaxID=35708 RepID=A0A0A8Z087_ARUDO